MKKFIVDRIEGDKAVLECENGDMVNLELKALPKNIKEGDVINFQENSYFLNSDETKARKEKIKTKEVFLSSNYHVFSWNNTSNANKSNSIII